MDFNRFFKAEQNYQYISSMRPVFNRKALFHRQNPVHMRKLRFGSVLPETISTEYFL